MTNTIDEFKNKTSKIFKESDVNPSTSMDKETKAMHDDFSSIMTKFLGPTEMHPDVFKKFVDLEIKINE